LEAVQEPSRQIEVQEMKTKIEILEKKVRGLMQFLEEERLKNYNLEMRLKGHPD
jgi:predicted RNA-binding protein Jag